MPSPSTLARNARGRLADLERRVRDAAGADRIDAARELVVVWHLIAQERLFCFDDFAGFRGGLVAAAEHWANAIARPDVAGLVRKSWSRALEGAIVAGADEAAARIAAATAAVPVPPEYDDEFAAAACLELWFLAGGDLAPARARIEEYCARAEQYLGAPAPAFTMYRAAAAGDPGALGAAFSDWSRSHASDVEARLASPATRPHDAQLARTWLTGMAVLRCASRTGFDAGMLLRDELPFVPAGFLFGARPVDGGSGAGS
jgi:hypothetical protein